MLKDVFDDNQVSLKTYFSEIVDSQPLSLEEEMQLAQRIKNGDEKARNKLVEANLRFVVDTAKEYRNRSLPLSELISAGNMGLMIAAERYDGTKGYKFISYAVWWIRQAILQALSQDSRMVRIPPNRMSLLRNISRTSRALEQEMEGDPGVEDIAKELGISADSVETTLQMGWDVKSLDEPFLDDDEHSLHDLLPDMAQTLPDTSVMEKSSTEQIELVLSELKEREVQVLRLYFGLDGNDPLTLEEVGERINLTRERVRQIKETALRKLRHPKRRAMLT